MLNEKQKADYISLLGQDMPISEILDIVGIMGADVLEVRMGDDEFDRCCEIGMRQQKSIILSGISKVEKDMLAGKYAFSNNNAAQVIKSLQWRLNYLDEYCAATSRPLTGNEESYRVELIEQVGSV